MAESIRQMMVLKIVLLEKKKNQDKRSVSLPVETTGFRQGCLRSCEETRCPTGLQDERGGAVVTLGNDQVTAKCRAPVSPRPCRWRWGLLVGEGLVLGT